ncbi:O-methylsterigmatocystin oxidoreductase OS=Aspergillus flavus GN=ordA PE=3 SV=2 [Rhizoctonia solani AG-1 IB]|uniref:O-methylsterigmatocystin oxidoreductase n=2 Tax=Rhizoctonia solani TaxID=456999 RepID=A0A0B7FRN3_THACB|nr:O-methylsterigmatocystin oxidoreductase OS=Aspergillus flavus GN=ordA PE=3 SV=2 [Rhizoctonia solani AG-1 IB]
MLPGDVISVSTTSAHFIYLNSLDTVVELLEKRAGATADRPPNVMVKDLMGWGEGVALHAHDERHKKMRRVIASALHPAAARSYAQQHMENTLAFVRDISISPRMFKQHAANAIGAFILRLTYGHVVTKNDTLISLIHEAVHYFTLGVGKHYLVNDIPLLKYVPSWFPGANFQKLASLGKELRNKYASEPFDKVFEEIRHNRLSRPSYTSRLLEEKGGTNASPEDIDLIKWTAAAMYLAGSTTTLHIVVVLFFMMALYPEVAQRAQAEIDSVVGRGRLPDFTDRESLPYVEALLQELMRMSPPTPLGFPHTVTEDIEFRGYRIPKGASINPNIWMILHDPKHYSSPHTFTPDRYLKPVPDPDPRKYNFGFGRRVCPGLHVANDTAWIMCVGVLTLFDIRAGEELNQRVREIGGRESPRLFELCEGFGAGLPLSFEYKITVRDQAAVELLESGA